VVGLQRRGPPGRFLLDAGLALGALVVSAGGAAGETRLEAFLDALARAFGGAPPHPHERWGQALGLVAFAVGVTALVIAVWAWQRRQARRREVAQSQIEHEISRGLVEASRLLHRGQGVLVEPQGTDLAQVYPVRIEGIDSRTLAVPTPDEANVLLHPGRGLMVSFRQGRYSYRFETEIMRRLPGPHSLLVLQRPEKVQRLERREFFRMEAYLPCRFRLDPQEAPASDAPELLLPYTGVITNLSGSGLRMVTDHRIRGRPLMTVSFTIEIPGGREQVEARAAPLTCESAEEGGYEVRARFTEIRRSQRERIVAFVVERERELLRRGIRT